MYVGTTQRRNKDGSVVLVCVGLAHHRRDGARTKAEVQTNLGREDRLDMDGLRRLAGSISRYLGDTPPDGDQLRPPDGGLPDGLDVVSSRPLGAAWLLDGLWRRLGIADALKAAVGGRRFTTDVERVLFALVANRAVEPCSKLAAAEWASADVAIPGLDGMDEDQAYRAMGSARRR